MSAQRDKIMHTMQQAQLTLAQPEFNLYAVGVLAVQAGVCELEPGDEFVAVKIRNTAPDELICKLRQMQSEVPVVIVPQSNRQHKDSLYNNHLVTCYNKSLPQDYYRNSGAPDVTQPLAEYQTRLRRQTLLQTYHME